jgi:NitT/TauT family transport system substrate-binding protein
MRTLQSRRRFLATLSSAGIAGVVVAPDASAQQAPPETTTIRLPKYASICVAPQYVADKLLRAEGFTEIRYVTTVAESGIPIESLVRGEIDFVTNFSPPLIIAVDTGQPITLLGGVHVGCFELFAGEGIRSIPDLKGKKVGVQGLGSAQHTFLSSIAAHVGLDPVRDINWVTSSAPKPLELFAEGKIDAFLGLPPEPQELRTRNFGRVIVNSAIDRPWSQYFCCMVASRPDFVRRNPIATKRVLRAIAKATDICASEPERVAQLLVDGGFAPRYDHALQTLKELPYNKWREYDPEDTVRFYSLRLREAGMIKSSPNRIIAQGADLRFFNELRRELKA